MTGTVFDIGYQSYTGIREGRMRSRLAVYKDGIRIALGFGRGGKAKILPWFFISILSGLSILFVLINGAADRLGGPGTAEQVNLPNASDYYGIASIIIFVFAALVGPELLCRDRREGTISLYLMRPLTGSDYIIGRWFAFLSVVLAAAWVPQFILFFGLLADQADAWTYLKTHWDTVPRFMLAGLAMSAYATTLAMLVASFTTRRAYASVFLVGLFAISTPFTIGLAMEVGGTVGSWISMFNLSNIPVHVNDIIFDQISAVTKDAPAGKLAPSVRVAWYFAWTLIPGLILWSRYRKLAP